MSLATVDVTLTGWDAILVAAICVLVVLVLRRL